MTALYLASRFARADELDAYALEARLAGLAVTSRWHTGDHGAPGADVDLTNPDMPRFAAEDLDDIRAADVVLSFTEGGGGRGGRHAEFGFGLALNKACVLVGPREHVFHTLPYVFRYDTWAEAVAVLIGKTR